MTARRTSALTAVVGGTAFVLLAVLLVPWHPIPGGAVDAADPSRYFTPAELARGEDYARWARLWSWSSLAVSLVVASVLGFTRVGRSLVGRLPGPWWVRVPLAVTAVELIGRVVTLPFAVALRRHALDYGLSNQAWSGFAADLAKTEGIDVVILSLIHI